MKKTILAVSVAAAMGLGVSQNALADSYAYAYNNIYNLQIVSSPGLIPQSTVFDLSNAATLSGFAPDVNADSFTSGVAPFDIVDANVGIASSNVFAANGFIGTNYSRGDAQIISSELSPGQPPAVTNNLTSVKAIAESYLLSNAKGTASGTVGSTSTFDFFAQNGTFLDFSFDASIDLLACVDGPTTCNDSNSQFASNAKAVSSVSFVITDSFGNTLYSWAPGTAPGVGDGGGNNNPFSLNTNVSRDQTNDGVATFSFDSIALGNGKFTSRTATFLNPGLYTLSLSDTKSVTTQLTSPVSEPETLALMGLSLLGVFFVNRRKIGTSGKTA